MHYFGSQIPSRELKVKHQWGFLGFKTLCSKQILSISIIIIFKGWWGINGEKTVLDSFQNS